MKSNIETSPYSFTIYNNFLWLWYERAIVITSKEDDSIHFKTENGEFEAKSSKKITIEYFLLKYIIVLPILLFLVSFYEIVHIDIIHLLAPICILIIKIYKIKRSIFILGFMGMVLLFAFYDISQFTYFIKYLFISFILISLVEDSYFNRAYKVYKKEKKLIHISYLIKRKDTQ